MNNDNKKANCINEHHYTERIFEVCVIFRNLSGMEYKFIFANITEIKILDRDVVQLALKCTL